MPLPVALPQTSVLLPQKNWPAFQSTQHGRFAPPQGTQQPSDVSQPSPGLVQSAHDVQLAPQPDPHWKGTPAPPQVPVAQVPQLSVPPQLSEGDPHAAPT